MLKTYEVSFSVFLDDALMESNSSLQDLRTTITAFDSFQAENMIKAQYQNRVRIWSVIQK